MNKNTFMYPVRMTAVLAAAALITSCAKDKFTEANALDLELKRLRTQDSIEVARERQRRIWEINSIAYQRVLDSLDRINAGGRVFYTVTVVAGGNAAFGTGRVEELEGVQGATVSIAQYGQVQTATTPASGMVTVELRSGSASVVASAPNHTTVNYTVNLTADGNSVTNILPLAPGNGHTVHVGNVIPLFPTSGAGTATVRGRAYIETDLTNETAELVTPTVLGAGTNLFTANIDINDVFRTRYLDITNNASGIGNANGTAFEGQINRISYENATTNVVVDAQGNYSGAVPATASGLPLQLRYSQIAADRRFWAASFDGTNLGTLDALNNRTGQVITRRFIYGPFPSGNDDPVFGAGPFTAIDARLSFNTELAPAQVTAALTNTGALKVGKPTWDPNNEYFILRPNLSGDASFEPDPADNGLYLTNVDPFGGNNYIKSDDTTKIQPPAVTFAPAPPGGQTATGSVVLTDFGVSADDAPFKRIRGIRKVNAGSGYTTAPTATFTRRDLTRGGANGTANITGTGSLQSPSDALSVIQVTNGGFGFLPQPYSNSPAIVSTPGAWTGLDPTVLYNGQNPLPAPKVTPTVTFSYNPIGTVNAINVINGGSGLVPADTNIGFSYGAGALLSTTQGLDGLNNNEPIALFMISPTGRVQFNDGSGNLNPGILSAVVPYGNAGLGITNTTFTFFDNFGNPVYNGTGTNVVSPGTQPYVFVPTASLGGANGIAVNNNGSSPTISVSVLSANAPNNQGLVAELTLSGGADVTALLGLSAGDPIPNMSLVVSSPGGNQTLAAVGYLAGTGIDNYQFDPTTNAQSGRVIAGPSTGTAPFGPTYPGYTPSGGSGLRKSNNLGATSLFARNNHTYIAKFSTPPNPPFIRAEAYPVFDNANKVVGLVITNPGAGYSQNQPITFEIVPNGKDAKDQKGVLVDPELVFTIVNGGSYAACPDVLLSGGGVTLAQQPQNALAPSSISYVPAVSSDSTTANNGDFEIKFDATTGAIKSIKYVGSAPLPPYTSAPINVTISPARQNSALNRAWNSVPASLPSQLVIGTYAQRSISTDAAGAITGINILQRVVTSVSSSSFRSTDTPIRFWELGNPPHTNLPSTPNDHWLHFLNQQYILPPAVNIASAAGTGAQAVAVLEDNFLGEAGKLRGINVVAGGSGYRVTAPAIPRNGSILATYSGSAANGFFRNFGISSPGDGVTGSALTNFEAFSGVTYIRDVHYGTGRYFGIGQ